MRRRKTYCAPVIINLLEGNRVEYDVGENSAEDGPVLDEVVVVRRRLFVHNRNYPLQHFVLQLNISLNKIEMNK